MNRAAVVLAAGKGTRMRSQLPKVLHQVAGQPMIAHVLEAVAKLEVEDVILVLGHGREQITEQVGGNYRVAVQEEQLGTAHALLQAEGMASATATLLVLSGDTPLLNSEELLQMLELHETSGHAATVMSAVMENPAGYGRILRDAVDRFTGIVEHKDATPEQLAIQEINTGIYCFDGASVFAALKKIRNHNVQQEYYLPDVLEVFLEEGRTIAVYKTEDVVSTQGINDRLQLAEAESILRSRILKQWMLSGVTVVDPATTYIGSRVTIGEDTILLPMTMLEGNTEIGSACIIGPSTRLTDSSVGAHSVIQNSVVLEAVMGDHCTIGPFAYLRPGAELSSAVKIGDFVEVKKSTVGRGSKIPHLSYIGDAVIGESVNIGAGTITCNYDGKHKHQTLIGDGAFIGSNSNLIAPITIGKGAMTGAGSSISANVKENVLAVERGTLKVIPYEKRNRGGNPE